MGDYGAIRFNETHRVRRLDYSEVDVNASQTRESMRNDGNSSVPVIAHAAQIMRSRARATVQ